MKKIRILLILISINLSVCFSSVSALVCSDLLTNKPKPLKFTEQNLKGFEMVASAIVWSLIRSGELHVSYTDYSDKNRLYESLNERQILLIHQSLQMSFDNIFKNEKQKEGEGEGQVGYLLMAERHSEGFKFSDLKELFDRDGNFVIKFLSENLEAIVFNGRRMKPLHKFWLPYKWNHIKQRFGNPNITNKEKKRWRYIFWGLVSGAALITHMDLSYAVGDCIQKWDCSGFIYTFQEAATYLDDSWMFMLYESSIPAAGTAVIIGSLHWISNRANSWRSTKGSPEFDPINFDDKIGEEIRIKFAKKAGAYSDVDLSDELKPYLGIVEK